MLEKQRVQYKVSERLGNGNPANINGRKKQQDY